MKTLKDAVAERDPAAIDDASWGGVLGCPSQYPFLNDTRSAITNGGCPHWNTLYGDDLETRKMYCVECWNRPYKPVNKEDKHMKTLKDIVAERNPDMISENATGGVWGCPGGFRYLKGADRWNIMLAPSGCPKWADPSDNKQVDADCAACWNQPYMSETTESKVEDTISCYIRPSKDEYYLDIAKVVSARSTCRRRRYGAVLVKDDRIIATGYNGAPRGTVNCIEGQQCERVTKKIPHGERYELCRAVHAEMNALLSAGREAIGATLYLQGIDGETSQPIAAEPCSICKAAILNAQVDRVVTAPFMSGGKLWTTDR